MGSGGGGGGSSPAYTWSEIRYAPYIESKHQNFLDTMRYHRDTALATNPFSGYTDVEVSNAFFGIGYTISSFPSLYDMYGKFMAGLDIEALWTQLYTDTLDSTVVNDLIAAESALLDDEIVSNSLPRFNTGIRDINSVLSSTYLVGKSLIEDTKTKLISKFSADLKYRLIPIAQERWSTHLNWNKNVVGVYAEIMKFYYSTVTDVNEQNYGMSVKSILWPFTVLDFERAGLGALQGATNSKQDVAGASTASKVISGALSGAAMGAMVGGSVSGTVAAGSTAPALSTATGTTAAGAATYSYAGAGAVVGAGLGIAAALTY